MSACDALPRIEYWLGAASKARSATLCLPLQMTNPCVIYLYSRQETVRDGLVARSTPLILIT